MTGAMTLDLVSWGAERYPMAEVVSVNGEWWVACTGKPESVLPSGVVWDDDFSTRPQRLRTSAAQWLDDLCVTATFRDASRAAGHLREHIANMAMPDFCGPHGRPMWHPERPNSHSCLFPSVAESLGVRLATVIAFANFVDAVRDASTQLATQRRGLSRRLTDDILAFSETPESQKAIVRAESEGGSISLPRSRALLRSALDGTVAASGLVMSTRWPRQRRPQLALVANSTLAIYVAELLMGIGVPPTALECSICGMPFTPKRAPRAGDGRFCSRPECQRRRQAANQARRRARLRVGHG